MAAGRWARCAAEHRGLRALERHRPVCHRSMSRSLDDAQLQRSFVAGAIVRIERDPTTAFVAERSLGAGDRHDRGVAVAIGRLAAGIKTKAFVMGLRDPTRPSGPRATAELRALSKDLVELCRRAS
jgi:hypothetical protein